MVNLNPPLTPQLVGEVLGTKRLPGNIVAALSDQLQVTKEVGGPMPPEKRYVRGVHYFLADLVSGVDPVPSFERVELLQVDPDGTVQVLPSMFSVPVNLYSTARRLFVY